MVAPDDRLVDTPAVSGDALRPLSDSGLDDRTVWGLVDAAPDGIVVTDESGLILLVNRQTEELFGYDRGELLGRAVEEFLPERSRQVHRAHRTRYRAAPRTRSMGAGLALFGRRHDGSEFPVEISLSPLRTDAGLRVVAVVRDIRERVEAEAKTRAILDVLDTTHDAVFILDAESLVFTYANLGASDQVGYAPDELVGMTMLHIAPEFTDATVRALFAPIASGEQSSTTFTTTHRHRDGTDFPVEILLQGILDDDGRPRAYVKIARDVRERLATEAQLRQAEQDLRMFADRERIARDLHDVVIQKLFASGLNLQGLAARATEPEPARRLAAVVDDIDDVIREVRAAIFSLHTDFGTGGGVRAEIMRIVADERSALGLEPRVSFEGLIDTLPAPISTELFPTLREALSNIARHAQATTANITITTDDHWLRLRVEDNGIGIPANPSKGNGIVNTTTRAANLGGTCHITRGEQGGTTLEWTVPLT